MAMFVNGPRAHNVIVRASEGLTNLAHLSFQRHWRADRGENGVLVVQHDTKHRSGKDDTDDAFDFNMLLFLLVHLIFLAVCTTGHFCPADYSGLMREKKGARLEKP